ncbi:MAG: DUF2269 family protein [Chloroflexota bacterium]|nr:DUF2269 family protein [Chloroflexota bacterium]
MSILLLVRFLHIASAIWFIGGVVARQIVRASAKRTDNVQRFAFMSEAAGRIESTMVIPGNFAVILFGIIYGLMIGAPILGFLQGASRNWLLVSNVLLFLGFFNIPLVFIPKGRLFELALKDALAKGQMTPELHAQMDDRTVSIVHFIELAALGVITVLMVFRPF